MLKYFFASIVALCMSSALYAQSPQDTTVYSNPDVQPAFPGGIEKFNKFLAYRVAYPLADRRNGVQGTVYISFIVEIDGSLSNIKPVASPSKTLEEESLKAVKSSPKWMPAAVQGKPVRASYTIPVVFSLGG